MVKNKYPILNLADATGLGLISGQFNAVSSDTEGSTKTISSSFSKYIHYVGTGEWGKRSSGVVLLHGGSGDWRHFGANLADLAAACSVVAVDLPGFGGSDPPATTDLAGVAAPVAAFVRSLNWDDVTLVGFSFGALVASEIALDCPLARLFLVSPAGFGAHTPEMATARDEAVRAAKSRGVRAGLEVNLLKIMLHRPDAIGHEPLLAAMEEMLRATRMKARSFSRSELIVDRLRHISCPVRVLFGASDPFHASVMTQRHADITAACPQARISIVEDAAHWLMLERPDIFEAALWDFCEKERAT